LAFSFKQIPSVLVRLPMESVNLAWLLADKAVRLTTGVLVGFLVARYLGPERFGELNSTLALVGMCMPLVDLGLDAVVRRRLIVSPDDAGFLLATTWRLKLSAAIVVYSVLVAYVLFCGMGVNQELLLILGLLVFQPAGLTADLWLQSNLHSRITVVTSWMALLLGAGCKLWLVWRGAGVSWFAWVAVVEVAMWSVLLVWMGKRNGLPRMIGGCVRKEARALLGSCWMLLLSGLAVMLYMKLDMVMLGAFAGEGEAGIYAAALRLSEIGYFLPMALASSMLPRLLSLKEGGGARYARAMQTFYDINAGLAYALVIPTVLLAGPLIGVAYGSEYAEAAHVLRWHACAAVFVFLGVARSQFWVSEGRYALGLLCTLIGAACNLVLNMWWIPEYGAQGAAGATLIAQAVAAWGGSWLCRDVRGGAVMQTRALLLPLFGWRYLKRK
jgi:polysaccharide transporter, PST family